MHSALPVSPRIVGLGASAGGLAALQQFLAAVPERSGLAYVVVQHLDPGHKALLVELLQKATAMPVCEASEGLPLRPDTVYVIPPGRELTVSAGLLHLARPTQARGRRLPIDLLLESLALDQGAHAIGIVLSGMGADGTRGLLAIKAAGGLTLVQQPDSACFAAMPASAIAAGCADIVDEAGRLPQRILQAGRERQPARQADEEAEAEALVAILALLREHCRHDLSDYKPSTLSRRVQRRMAVHALDSKAAYEAFVRRNPQELELLFKELLIGVTSFFRDPATWEELKQQVLPALLQGRPVGERLRAWVVGCSTGEEAYSLAMAYREVVDEFAPAGSAPPLQIFASDLSADAIAVARRGRYPARIAEELTLDRLARFFMPDGDGYQIDKAIREMVLFAQHDVILDPPFTKLELLSCRNLMIYFNATLQRRLIPLFHYSLAAGRRAAAGQLGDGGQLASPVFAAECQVAPVPSHRQWPAGAGAGFPGPVACPAPIPFAGAPLGIIDLLPLPICRPWPTRRLLLAFSPPAVLVNAQGDIVYINGSTGKYLEPAAGKANWNIHVMARPTIRAQVAAALRQVVQDQQAVELPGLRLDAEGLQLLDLSVRPLDEPRGLAGLVMIVFRDAASVAPARARRRRSAAGVDPALSEELQHWKDEVRALRQEMVATAEELQAANEELQSTNEELQSANEELTTSKEEAQSMNEELQTLNGELQSKLDDLSLAQSDMQNLLNSTDIATLFLDNSLNVRRYTEQIKRVVHLREGDIGRPLTDLASTLNYPDFYADAQETLRNLHFTERQISTTDGLWFLVRIKPYRTVSNVIQGVVITLIDITAAKTLELQLRNPA